MMNDLGHDLRHWLWLRDLVNRTAPTEDDLLLVTSPVERCAQSLAALLSGLYPDVPSSTRFTTTTADKVTNPLTFPYYCGDYWSALDKLSQQDPQLRETYRLNNKRFAEMYMREFNISAEKVGYTVSLTVDAVGAMRCNNLPVPPPLTDAVLTELSSYQSVFTSGAIAQPTNKPYFVSPMMRLIVAALGREPAVRDPVVDRVVSHLTRSSARNPAGGSGPAKPRPVSLFSGHDITIMNLVTALTGKPVETWPSYATSLRIEVYAPKDDPQREFVRFILNEDVLYAACGRDGGRTSFCSMDDFLLHMAQYMAPTEGKCIVL